LQLQRTTRADCCSRYSWLTLETKNIWPEDERDFPGSWERN
jgi:hypothetical protein